MQKYNIINRPGVAGAVLKTPLSLIDWFLNPPFSSKYSKYHTSQTIRARDLQFWDNLHQPLCVTCHMLHVTCHVKCHVLCVTQHHYSQTVKAKDLQFLVNVYRPLCVLCPVPNIMLIFFYWWSYLVEDLLSTNPV